MSQKNDSVVSLDLDAERQECLRVLIEEARWSAQHSCEDRRPRLRNAANKLAHSLRKARRKEKAEYSAPKQGERVLKYKVGDKVRVNKRYPYPDFVGEVCTITKFDWSPYGDFYTAEHKGVDGFKFCEQWLDPANAEEAE